MVVTVMSTLKICIPFFIFNERVCGKEDLGITAVHLIIKKRLQDQILIYSVGAHLGSNIKHWRPLSGFWKKKVRKSMFCKTHRKKKEQQMTNSAAEIAQFCSEL